MIRPGQGGEAPAMEALPPMPLYEPWCFLYGCTITRCTCGSYEYAMVMLQGSEFCFFYQPTESLISKSIITLVTTKVEFRVML